MSTPIAHSTIRSKEQRLRRDYPHYYARYRAVAELLVQDLAVYQRYYEAKGVLRKQRDGLFTLVLNTEDDAGNVTPPPAVITFEFNYVFETTHIVDIIFTDNKRRLTASI